MSNPKHEGWFWAKFVKADCFWVVIAPIGVIVSRWPTRDQALEEVQNLNEGLARARRSKARRKG